MRTKLFKSNIFLLSLLMLESPALGQGIVASGKSTARTVTRHPQVFLPTKATYLRLSMQSLGQGSVRPIYSAFGSQGAADLKQRIERSVRQAMRPAYSTEQVVQLTRKKQFSPQLVSSALAIPESSKRLAVLRNEFLTISTEGGSLVSAEQLQMAVLGLRKDLILKLPLLNELKRYRTLPEITQAFSKDVSVRAALELIGNISGIGLYGEEKDGALALQLYEALQETPLEPLALTAAVRAGVNLNDLKTLQSILSKASHTSTYEHLLQWLARENLSLKLPVRTTESVTVDLSSLRDPLEHISRLAVLHLDDSAPASMRYRSWRVNPSQINSRAAAEVTQETEIKNFLPIEAELLPPPSLQVQAPMGPVAEGRSSQTGLPGKSPSSLMPVSSESGVYEPVIPQENELPHVNPITKQYPSGLQNADRLVATWLEYYRNKYFRPRNQIEAIRGMSPAKANNVMEYLYHMSLPEAERVILDPIRQTGRLPDFMYDARLIPGTKRLPAGYYKNKFNRNVRRFIELAGEDGSVFTRNAELNDLITSMEDYTFEQGFAFKNDPNMSAELRRHWKVIVDETLHRGMQADRNLMNLMWEKPIHLANGQTISLREYFSQKSPSAFFEEGRMPEFYLNSPKWVSWENERRNLAAQEYMNQLAPTQSKSRSWWQRGWEKVQDFFVLGKRSNYLTLDQFGQVMTDQYQKSYGAAWQAAYSQDLLADPTGGPSTCTMKINNFDQLGGVCQASFGDGGFAGRLPKGYDGTSRVSRFTPVNFTNVPVVGFDLSTLTPRVMTLENVAYLKDLKTPNVNKMRASIMVRDGLDVTRDLLNVQHAEAALFKIPHLKATIYPHSRLTAYEGEIPPFMDGGGLAGYLALFTPDFYPLKKVMRVRWQEGKLRWVPEYFVRREIPTLAGLVHRSHLTFTYMLLSRVAKSEKSSPASGGVPSQK